MKSILLALALGIVPPRAEETARPPLPAADPRYKLPVSDPGTKPAAEPGTQPAAEPRSTRPVSDPLKSKQPKHHGKPPVEGVVNVNRASEAELRLLPGIGKGRAKAIVERRSKRPFTGLDDLARMKGMKSVVRKLRPHLATEGDTTVHRQRP